MVMVRSRKIRVCKHPEMMDKSSCLFDGSKRIRGIHHLYCAWDRGLTVHLSVTRNANLLLVKLRIVVLVLTRQNVKHAIYLSHAFVSVVKYKTTCDALLLIKCGNTTMNV